MRAFAASLLALMLLLGTVAPLFAEDVHVKGYYRRDGTYVQPHMRSAPDSSYNNNWSTYPNVNPYTGQQGTREPRLYDSNPGLGGQGSDYGLGGTQRRGRSRY
jgi:hypothetical protein